MLKKRKLTFWNQEFEKESYWMFQNLSTTCFTFSGFSLTALSVVIGFYKDNLSAAAVPISGLLLSMTFFLVAGEMAREAYKVWKCVFAETMYMFTSAILSGALLYFVWVQPTLIVDTRLLFILSFPVLYVAYRGFRNIVLISRVWYDWRKNPNKETAQG